MAARVRNYAAERARRAALARERGLPQRYARGHGATPERPERAAAAPWRFPAYFTGAKARERVARISDAKLAEWNLLRNLEGKHEIHKDDPGAGAGRRQVFGEFGEAESWASAIPIGYVTLYPEREAWGVRIQRAA